jgi:hypothetical protein
MILIGLCPDITEIMLIVKFNTQNPSLEYKKCCVVLGLWCLMSLQQYFSYISAVSFIGGGNWSTQRKPPTSCEFESCSW